MILNPGSKNYFTGKSSAQISKQSLQINNPVSKNKITINTASRELQMPDSIVPANERKEKVAVIILTEEKKVHTATSRTCTNRNIFSNKKASQFLSEEKYLKTTKDSLSTGNKKDNAELQKEDSLNNDLLSIEKKKTGAHKKAPMQNGLYAGIIAGVDYSKVKSTSFNGPGFNMGILIGYRIKSVFVETGVSRGVKYYSSMGDMFNDHDAPMPSGMTIDNLESRSKILEIPLKAGYYIYKKKKTNFFIAAGASIYIMTKEKNNYNVTMNGNPEKMVGLYEKNNLKIPAVVSISAGWEYHLPRLFKLRIEPVLKLPLQGIGVGKLPVTSAGIQLGITKMLK